LALAEVDLADAPLWDIRIVAGHYASGRLFDREAIDYEAMWVEWHRQQGYSAPKPDLVAIVAAALRVSDE
jgi:hypothetical protein